MELSLCQKRHIELVSFLVTDIDDNPEYVRGMCETISVLFPPSDPNIDNELFISEIEKYLTKLVNKT